MRPLPSPLLAAPCFPRRTGPRLSPWPGLLLAVGFWLNAAVAQGAAAPAADGRNDFLPLVKLAPFVVNGQQLAVSIHARTNGDRRYAEGFAGEVMKVVYEAVTPETGKGLVIIGQKGEPHPIFVFRKFLALAKEGKLDPAVAARGPELLTMLNHWQHTVDDENSAGGDKGDKGSDVELEFEKIVTALPLPLEGIGAKLYQLAWAEKFDEAKVEAGLRALRAPDLERDWFAHFDWVFYLPPKGAFDRALDELIADALKKEDVGFFARTAVKGVLLVVKPKIRQAIEALRHGVMFMTVVQARTHYAEPEVSELTDAYVEALMPGEKSRGGTEHERAVDAVRERIRLNAEQAKNPPAAPAASAPPKPAG